jgi:DDE superfamily endonuclease
MTGDSGYPQEPWLMTPVTVPTTPSEQAYNLAHAKTRNIIERCFGVLKSRFRCLDKSGGTLLYKPGKACKIFVASAVLHNFCISHSLEILPDPDVVARHAALQPATTNTQTTSTQHTAAVEMRRRIIRQF